MSSNQIKSVAIVLTLIAGSPAYGGELDIKSRVSTTLSYNDNPTLRPDELDPDAALYLVADYKVTVSQQSPDTSISFTPQITRIEYLEDKFDDLSATEYRLNSEITKSYGLVSIGGQFGAANQTILTSEDSDPEDPSAGSTGNFLTRDDRVEKVYFSPYLTWTVTERDQLIFSTYLARNDQIKDFSPRADYNVRQGSVQFTHALADRHVIGLAASGSRTETLIRARFCALPFQLETPVANCRGVTVFPDEGLPGEAYIVTGNERQDIETYDFGLTYDYEFSEQLKLKAKYGQQKTDVATSQVQWRQRERLLFNDPDFVRQGSSTADFQSATYLFSLNYTLPRSMWLLEITRNIQPTSQGSPTDKTQARGVAIYKIGRLVTAKLAAIYYRQALRTTDFNSKNKFFRTDLTLTWNLTRNLTADSTYIYRSQDPFLAADNINLDSQNLSRKSHNLLLTLRYKF